MTELSTQYSGYPKTEAIEAPTFEPLDEDACRHQLALMKSLLCARPVLVGGREEFIKVIGARRSGCA